MTLELRFSTNRTTETDYGTEFKSIGENIRLNQVNGSPVSLISGLPDLKEQFENLGFSEFRTHDMFGAFDIDNAVNPSFKKNYTYIPQVSNNVEGALAEEVKYFAADFLNFRSIAPNLHEVMLSKNGSVGDIKLSWSSSDNMMKKIMNYSSKNQSKIHYRIGRSLNGGPIKPERIDLYIYVVKQIVDRYTNRWKEIGLPRPVEEYAIWNEPDLPFFFTGQNPRDPRTEYFNMYSLLAKAVKEMAPSALVGGPGVATYSSEMFLERFLRYCSKTNAPLDFLTIANYSIDTSDPRHIIKISNYINAAFDLLKMKRVGIYVVEWNSTALASRVNNAKLQSAFNAAYIISFLICAEQAGIEKAFYYRADAAEFGMFNNEYTN